MKKIALSLLTTLAMSSLVYAEGDVVPGSVMEADNSNYYIGLGISANRVYSIESKWFDKNTLTQDQVGVLSVVLGYEYNPYIAVEGRIGTSFFEEDYANLTAYSIFFKPQYPVTEEVKIYGLLGFGNVNIEGTDGRVPAADEVIGHTILDETSFQWGFGISYNVIENADIFFDFTRLMGDGDINSRLYDYDPLTYSKLNVDVFTFGINYRF